MERINSKLLIKKRLKWIFLRKSLLAWALFAMAVFAAGGIFIYKLNTTSATVSIINEGSSSNPTTFSKKHNPAFKLDTKGKIHSEEELSATGFLAVGQSTVATEVLLNGKPIDMHPTISVKENSDDFEIKFNATQFRPGNYTLKLIMHIDGEEDFETTQDFTWGVLAINFDQSTYKVGEQVNVGMAVLDDDGKTICDADLMLQITDPAMKLITLSSEAGNIFLSEFCQDKSVTDKPDYGAVYSPKIEGIYHVVLTAETVNGVRTISENFEVNNNPEFVIKRQSATRIYPLSDYKVNIEITANSSLSGISEKVPTSFKITEISNNGTLTKKDETSQTIFWQTPMQPGESISLSYIYDAPDISPQFYLLGPVEIWQEMLDPGGGQVTLNQVFAEPRLWQIASDDTVSPLATSYSADGALGAWTNPTYAYNDDGSQYATRTGSSKNTWYGNLYGFDLSGIPDGSTINTVTITAEWHNSGADTSGPVLRVGHKSGGSDTSTFTDDTSGQVADEVVTYQPTGLTAANLKATGASGFWAIIRFRRTDNTAHTASLDYVKCTVDYTPPASVAGSLYDAIGGSKISTSKTIKVSVNGDTAASGSTTSGDFNVALAANLAANDVVSVFVDGDATVFASTVTKVSATGSLSGINLYQNYTTIRHEGSITSITNTDLAVVDNLADTDHLISVDGSSNATFTKGLYILGAKTYAPGGNAIIGGNYQNAGTYTASTYTTEFNASSGTQTLISGGTGTGYLFNNLSHTGAGILQLVTNGVDINGTFTNSAGTFDADTNDLAMNFAGDWNNTGSATFSRGSGTLTFDGTSLVTNSSSNAASLGAVTITGTTTLGSSLTMISNTGAGTLNLGTGSYTLTLSGTGTPLGVTTFQNGTTSTVLHTGTGSNTYIAAKAYDTLTISPTSATNYYLTGNLDTAGSTAISVEFIVNNYATVDTVSGSNYTIESPKLTINSGGILLARNSTITLTGSTVPFDNTGGTFTAGGSTLVFKADADINALFYSTGSPTHGIYNVTLSPTTSTGRAYTLCSAACTLNIGGAFLINPGGNSLLTVNIASATLAVVGTTTIQRTSTATSSLTTAASSTTTTFGALTIETGGTFSPGSSSTSYITGNFNNTNGSYTINSDTLNFSAASPTTQTLNSGGTGAGKIFNNLTHSGTGTLQLSTNAINIDGVFTNSAGTFDANGLNMTVADDFLASGGTFSAGATPGTQTVTLDSTTEATVSGSSTFNNLTINTTTDGAKTVKFTAGTTQTINGTWTLDGDTGKVLTLRSATDTSAWYFIIPAGFTSGDYIDVKDSQNTTNAYRITSGADVTNSGNNVPGWLFITSNSISGSLYDGIGGSKISASKTIKISINGGTAVSGATSSGDYDIDLGVYLAANDIIAVFVDGDASVFASTITKVSATGDLSGIDLYDQYTTIRHEGDITSIINTDLATVDNLVDSDHLVTVDGSNVATFTKGLYLYPSKNYTPGGSVNTTNLNIATGSNYTAGSYTHTLSGTGTSVFVNNGTFTYGTSTIKYTNATSATILGMTGTSGTNGYYNLETAGAGTYTLSAATKTNNDLTITSGTLNGGTYGLTINGNYNNAGGTFTANSSTVTFDATDTGNTLSGTMTGTSAFYKLAFNGASGAWTINDPITVGVISSTNVDATDTFNIIDGTVTLGNGNDDDLIVGGKFNIGADAGAGHVATFQTYSSLIGTDQIIIDINQNGSGTPPACTNCSVAVGASDTSTGSMKLSKNVLLRLNPYHATSGGGFVGVDVADTGYYELMGSIDETSTDTGISANRETKICTATAMDADEHNGKVVRMTSGLARGKIYDITDTLATDADCALGTHSSLVRVDNTSVTETSPVLSGTGSTRTLQLTTQNGIITANDQENGRYVHNLTTGYYYKIVDSAQVGAGLDSLKIIAEPSADFTNISTDDDIEITDGVQIGDNFEVYDYASMTAESGLDCSSTPGEGTNPYYYEAYLLAASGSETKIQYASVCNLGANRSTNNDKYGVTFNNLNGSTAGSGVVIDKSKFINNFEHIFYKFTKNINSNYSQGITNNYFSGSANYVAEVFSSNNNHFDNNYIYQETKSFYIGGTSGSNVVSNNIFSGSKAWGAIGVYSSKFGNLISNNIIFSSNNSHLLILSTYGGNLIVRDNEFFAGNYIYYMSSTNAGNYITSISNDLYASNYAAYVSGSNAASGALISDDIGIKALNNTMDIGYFLSGAHKLSLYNTTLSSTTEVSGVTATGAYIISRNHDGVAGATKVWGEYSIPATDNAETPQLETTDKFNYANNTWEKSVTPHGYAGTGTEDTNIAYDTTTGPADFSSGPYTYRVVTKTAGSGASCGTSQAVFDVYRDSVDVGDLTSGTEFTDTNGSVNLKFTIECGATAYVIGDTYTFVAFDASNDGSAGTPVAKSISMMQDSDNFTVPSGTTLELKGQSAGTNLTTVTHGTGGYNFIIAGTIDAQYYSFDYMGNATSGIGLDLQSGATITNIADGAYSNFQNSGSADTYIKVDGSLIGTGTPSKTFANVTFTEASDGVPEYTVTESGGSPVAGNYWLFDDVITCTGWTDCEASDSDAGDGAASPNEEGFIRFSLGNVAPGSPSSLLQKKVTGGATLATGGWTSETQVQFTATITDDDSDQVKLCVEKDILGNAFSDTEDLCGDLVASGGTATVTITSQTDASEYHWQARSRDENDEYSASWVAYGDNAESARDYGVDTTAPTSGTIKDGNDGTDDKYNNGSLSALSAYWSTSEPNFDVSGKAATGIYQYAIGTTVGGNDVKDWTATGNSGADSYVDATGLTLRTGQTYFFSVKATDAAGNIATINSDGVYVAPTLTFSYQSGGSVVFDELNAGNSYTDSSKTTVLRTSTNAYGGYIIKARAIDKLRHTGDLTKYIPHFRSSGLVPNSAPESWTGIGFGYTTSDDDLSGGTANRFTSGGPKYAGWSETGPGDPVADHTANITGTPISNEDFTITYRVTGSATDPAGTYSTTIVYTCIPQY